MANWQHRIDVRETWKDYKAGRRSVSEVAGIVERKLRDLQEADILLLPILDHELEDICLELGEIVDDQDNDVERFDDVLEQLYDWADAGHHLWVGTR